MSKRICRVVFLYTFFAILLGWSGFAFAGAPAPAPIFSGPHPEHQIANLGDFEFENGQVVKDFKMSYITHGELNEKQDNVILVLHHFWGNHHTLDFLIGANKALDTNKYLIVATDRLGNSFVATDVSTGPTNSNLRMDFPAYSYHDLVTAEYRLLRDYLDIKGIRAVLGVSTGAMMAYQMAVSYPHFSMGIIPISGSPINNGRTRYLLRDMMNIITLDGGWNGGNYEVNPATGVITAMTIFGSWYNAPNFYAKFLNTKEQYLGFEKQIYHFHKANIQDARDLYFAGQAWFGFDIGNTPGFDGNIEAALRSISANTLIINAETDQFFPHEDLVHAKSLIRNSNHLVIDSLFGHGMCCGIDPEATEIMSEAIAKFIEELR